MREKMDFIVMVRKFVVDKFLYGDGDRLADETSFLEDGIIDSTGVLELVAFLEETYGIRIADDELVPENLNSLVKIGAYLERKIDAISSV